MTTASDRFLQEQQWHIPHRYVRGPLDDDELWEYIFTMWDIRIPRKQVCKGHVSPFRALADAYFARHPVIILKGSRGFGGKTFLLATLALTESAALGAHVNLLGGSAAQSMRVQEVVQQAIFESPRAPRNLLAKEPTKYDTYFTTGGHIRALLASQRSVRGPHPQRLRLDEIDEMDLDILEAAQGQPMTAKGITTQTLMSSTHQYPDGTMTEMLRRARDRGWPVYEWCYKETSAPPDGWLSKEDIERKRNEVSEVMWKMEYDLHEPSFDVQAIDRHAVEFYFNPDLGSYAGESNKYLEFEAPVEGAKYVTGVDWAKEKDYSVFVTYRADAFPWRMVAFERVGRLPWPAQVARLDKRLNRYKGLCAHDATGLGNVVADLIEHDKVQHVVLSKPRKDAMLNEYIGAIEDRNLIAPRIKWMFEEHLYVRLEALFGTQHTPDSVIAGAMAWSLHPAVMRKTPTSVVSLDRGDSPWEFGGGREPRQDRWEMT